jgi:hypothetical protein
MTYEPADKAIPCPVVIAFNDKATGRIYISNPADFSFDVKFMNIPNRLINPTGGKLSISAVLCEGKADWKSGGPFPQVLHLGTADVDHFQAVDQLKKFLHRLADSLHDGRVRTKTASKPKPTSK